MVMVSDNIKIDLQGITKTYIQIRPRRSDYPDTLETIIGLVNTRDHYPSYLIYQEGAGDARIPLILLEFDGVTVKEAYEEVKDMVNENCKFGPAKLIFPPS